MGFCHLHLHTEYSLLDGLCRLKDLIKKARGLSFDSLALTDHGGLYGMVPFYKTCMENGIKPLIGCEIYVVDNMKKREGKESPNHLVLLAENDEGLKNLYKIISLSHLEGFYFKPRTDKTLLSRYSKGLIALSGCVKGKLPELILKGDIDGAKTEAKNYMDIFGKDNFFLELQYHGLPLEKKVNFWLLNMSKELKLDIVATNDVHFIEKTDYTLHRVLMAVQTLSTVEEFPRYTTPEHYLKSEEEMKKLFLEVPRALLNTEYIAKRCDVKLALNTPKLPKTKVPEGFSEEEYLKKMAFEGAFIRYGYPLPDKIEERLLYELSVISKTGFTGYFLVVKEIIDFARQSGIMVGPGRGSAAGSLVAYCLFITDVDPVKYHLIFERFLNPERISPPDIDVDLCHTGRRKVLDFIRERFGKENIAHAGAFSTLQARAVLRDTGRAIGLPYETVDRLTSFIPYSAVDLGNLIVQSPGFKNEVLSSEKTKKAFYIAKKLQGLPRHMTQHSAGVVIADKPLTEYVPLERASGEEIITQADMYALEEMGLVKIDLLGLRFLSVIDSTLKFIEKTKRLKLSLKDIPLNDSKTFETIKAGNTTCTFQLESSGMRSLLRKVGPECIEEISHILALYRPGPITSGMTEEYVKRKKGESPVSFPHPLLEEVLSSTYGVFIYQEQLMQAANIIADYSLGEADLLRRAIAKKDREKIEKEKPKFLERAKKKGIEEKTALEIFSTLEAFGDYGFNKSHSISYALLAYYTVYLKVHHPVEYFSSLLTLYMDTPSRLQRYLCEARNSGIQILLPDINKSGIGFTPETEEGKIFIRTGLGLIKNLGPQGIKEIYSLREEEPFSGFFNFVKRVNKKIINSKSLESLILAGCFDSFGIKRPVLLLALKKVLKETKAIDGNQLSIGESSPSFEPLIDDVMLSDFSSFERLSHELLSLGHYITRHPMEFFEEAAGNIRTHTLSQVGELQKKTKVCVTGIITDMRRARTRKGERMLFASLEDLTGSLESVFFPEVIKKCELFLEYSRPLVIWGTNDINDDGTPTIVAEKILPLEEVCYLSRNSTA